MGFSVHDTIVVFDRLRENLRKSPSQTFSDIADLAITQTLGRSLATSLTVIFVLLALFLLGGESIKPFVMALLLGVTIGTYSSIFNATPLLVVWQNTATRRR
jgi:preprotein translocase SecF subunit